MEESRFPTLSEAEWDIMRVLWHSPTPLRAGEIVKKLSEKRSWKTQTAHVLLGRLCDKGFCNVNKDGYYHTFSQRISEKAYMASTSRQLRKQFGGSVQSMVASLLSDDGVTEDDLDALSALLAEKKRALAKKQRRNEP